MNGHYFWREDHSSERQISTSEFFRFGTSVDSTEDRFFVSDRLCVVVERVNIFFFREIE